jgi:hypothetical protein
MNEELYWRDLRHGIAVRAAYEEYQRARFAYSNMKELSHWRTRAREHREMIETLHWVRTGKR